MRVLQWLTTESPAPIYVHTSGVDVYASAPRTRSASPSGASWACQAIVWYYALPGTPRKNLDVVWICRGIRTPWWCAARRADFGQRVVDIGSFRTPECTICSGR
jgi:hypothetical protein